MATPSYRQKTTALSSATPSYARPTAASQGRRALQTGLVPTAKSQQASPPQKATAPTPTTPVRLNNNTLLAITKFSHASYPSKDTVGFFHLPGELRNTIYELTDLPTASRRLDLTSERPYDNRLPALLRADHRLLIEGGSYYFPNGHFDILVDQGYPRIFIAWFTALEPINQAHLARNRDVTISLVHTSHRSAPNFRNGGDQLHVCIERHGPRILAEGRVTGPSRTRFPGLSSWRMSVECRAPQKSLEARRRWHELHPNALVDEKMKAKVGGLMQEVYGVLGRLGDESDGALRKSKVGCGKRGGRAAGVEEKARREHGFRADLFEYCNN